MHESPRRPLETPRIISNIHTPAQEHKMSIFNRKVSNAMAVAWWRLRRAWCSGKADPHATNHTLRTAEKAQLSGKVQRPSDRQDICVLVYLCAATFYT